MRNRVSFLLLVLFLAAAGRAQQHPNVERGLMPDKSYEVGDVDAINLFNGSANIAIPLGQKYLVNGNLSYQFSLSNASNSWEVADDPEVEHYDNEQIEAHYQYTIPQAGQNAGFGWLFTFGAIGIYARDGYPSYLSPDGGRHRFYDTLHGISNEASSGVRYTRDGTYLRLREVGNTYELDFPNGDKHIFDKVGTTGGRLRTMMDAFGNTVTITYGTRPSGQFAGSAQWTIVDSTGRSHYVYFRPSPAFVDPQSTVSEPGQVVDFFDLAAFNGSRAIYRLEYLNGADGVAPSVNLARRCVYPIPPNAAFTAPVQVPVLSAIQLPVGRYEMQYDLPGGTACTASGASVSGSGNLTWLKLPTGATIDYGYGTYHYPGSSAYVRDPIDGPLLTIFYTDVLGVRSRVVKDRDGTVLSETEYVPESYPDQTQFLSQRRIVRRKNAGVVVREERHYFVTRDAGDYGLPYAVYNMPPGGPFLSTEIITPNGTRSTYVTYEGESAVEADGNRRLKSQKTVYEDGKSSEVVYSNFDGLGHYRTSTVTDNMGGSVATRSSYTNFNPNSGELIVAGNTISGTFVMPATWLLTTFDIQQSTDNGQTSTSRACFDATGFLTSRRMYTSFGTSPTAQGSDLLAIFQKDNLGNVSVEQYLGGDTEQAPDGTSGVPAPTTNCVTSSASETYRIAHRYASGSPAASYAVQANGQSMSFFTSDVDIDANTGLPRVKRDASTPTGNGSTGGMSTNLTYDVFGRLALEEPQGSNRGARRRFVYAADLSTIEIFEETASNTQLRKRTLTLDGLGRVVKETRSMPNGLSASREWRYDGLGRMTAASTWGNGTPLFTRLQYDVFDRPVLQTNPDNSTTVYSYTGVSGSTVTSKVRTAGTADDLVQMDATTAYTYDGEGRIRTATEPNGIVTRYTYDVAGRLTNVCGDLAANCVQNRNFTYDNRGFLIAEQTPELGTSGNGAASYRYDARGNMIHRTVGSPEGDFDVWMRYDRAGRLESAYEAKTTGGVHRNLTTFAYGTANSGSDYRNGRITSATSYNWFNSDGFSWQITESYVYEGIDGRVSKQSTSDVECAGTPAACNPLGAGTPRRSFESSFTYDQLGAVLSANQPKCLHSGCYGLIPDRTVTNTYDNGWLTTVNWTGSVNPSSLTYHPNGMVAIVTHGNQVQDLISLDAAVPMPRPALMETVNAIEQATCVAPSFQTQPQSTTVTPGSPTATLSATATGETGFQITYQWYVGISGDSSSPYGAPSTSGQTTATPSATTRYWVEARTSAAAGCPARATASQTATVTVCTPPSITAQPQGATITRGNSITLQVAATGSATLTYRWFTVVGQTATEIQGANASQLQVMPQSTTSYLVKVSNDCGEATSATVTVTVLDPPTVPAAVLVTSNGSVNNVTWSASLSSAGIARYEVRRHDGLTWSINMPGSLILVDGPTGLTTGAGYRYQVRAIDQNNVASAWSAEDYTVTLTFTDPAVQGLVTPVRGIHIGQLRQAVDGIRAAVGLSRVWTSYAAVSGPVRASYVVELRNRLQEARAVMDLPPLQYTNPVMAISNRVRAADIQELRSGVN